MALRIAGLVTGAGRAGLPYGLFSVLSPRTTAVERWEAGADWETGTCSPAGGRGQEACGDPSVPGLPKTFARGGQVGEASSFVIYGTWECSPIGYTPEAAQAKAEEHLIAREEARVEQALWTGDLGNTPNLSGANGYTAPTQLTGGSVANAIVDVENWLATTYGSLGVIHMSRANALRAIADKWLETKGGRLITRLGTPVVAGAGYPSNEIKGTPALFGYRSDPYYSSNVSGDLLDRGTNTLYAVAERTYLIGFDPCGVASAPTGIGG